MTISKANTGTGKASYARGETINCWVDFNQARPSPSGALTAWPIILANGVEVGTFRQYHQSGNWGAVFTHQPNSRTTGKNAPSKIEALRILARRLERQSRILIDMPESDGGGRYAPRRCPRNPAGRFFTARVLY